MDTRIIFSADTALLKRLDARRPPGAQYGRARVIRDLLERGLDAGEANIPVQAMRRLQCVGPELQAAGVTGVTLFGSRIQGAPRPDSDLDIGVDYDAARVGDLFNLMTIRRRILAALDGLGAEPDIAFLPDMRPAARRRHDETCLRVI